MCGFCRTLLKQEYGLEVRLISYYHISYFQIGLIMGNCHNHFSRSSSPLHACRLLKVTYLIFVISFTQAGFFNPKFLHPKTMQNTRKLQQIPPKSVKYAVLCVQSGKFYTGQIFFTRALPVVPATNMRYEGPSGPQISRRTDGVGGP